mmetsp:Transcript_8777/g.19402  ORF Transcript_8777/g.19402 Transcript_8777/m.19402 type:complete len:232 (+) Transcript_8777:326-1021(+)
MVGPPAVVRALFPPAVDVPERGLALALGPRVSQPVDEIAHRPAGVAFALAGAVVGAPLRQAVYLHRPGEFAGASSRVVVADPVAVAVPGTLQHSTHPEGLPAAGEDGVPVLVGELLDERRRRHRPLLEREPKLPESVVPPHVHLREGRGPAVEFPLHPAVLQVLPLAVVPVPSERIEALLLRRRLAIRVLQRRVPPRVVRPRDRARMPLPSREPCGVAREEVAEVESSEVE